jgi:hypothetical protein
MKLICPYEWTMKDERAFNLGSKDGKKQATADFINDEIGFMNYLIEYPELCREKCKERRDKFEELKKQMLVEKNNEHRN